MDPPALAGGTDLTPMALIFTSHLSYVINVRLPLLRRLYLEDN